MDLFPLLDRRPDHSQRRAISAGGQRSGIAVGEHASAGRHQSCAVRAHGLVSGNVLGMHALRFFDQGLLDLRQRTYSQQFKLRSHAPDRPEKIHRRRPGLADDITNLVKLLFELANISSLRIFYADRDSHSRRYTNRRRAPHHHVPNYVGDLEMSFAGDVSLLHGELRLIDEAHAAVGPFEGLNHAGVLSSQSH